MKRRRLRVTSGPLEGSVFVLEGELILGRGGDTDVQILSKSISREHARVRASGLGRATIKDLGSRNGTWVNNRRVTEELLSNGDELRIGETTIVYEEVEESTVDEPITEEVSLKVLSGAAEETTVVKTARPPLPLTLTPPEIAMARATEPPEDEGCGSPLHLQARVSGWRFCPNCAHPVT